ncbi:protein cordon-bleu isoform X2 [Lutra lutra]|uniref:protein cordon-bleu isoform X2 n=1 Tax=Lutra lutra TaxID=9657 RepID=UPI001FD2B105|nr:protein cordon-bleu isoform X2 [Lutra lutra]
MDAPRASAAKPPTGRKMKARAPPPPGKPATANVHSEQKPPRDVSPGPPQNLLHMKENLRNSTVAVTVVLPSGLEKKSVVSGSHAMMDLLVELCLQNHLNPSHHALEIRSSETQQPLSFKPNTLVGTLNVHTVFLKEKVPEEKVKPAPPKVPEKSVRLVVNYLRTQKAVVRVSPEVPLQNILPVICAKCEVSPEHVVLLRDNIAGEELELSKSLNELGIKELYAWDNKRVLLTKTQSEPSLSSQETFRKSSLGHDETDKEKKKILGFFKVNKRSSSKAERIGRSGVDSDEDTSQSALGRGSNGCLTTPNSPSVNSRSVTLGPSLSLSNISGVSVRSDLKKRRAPPPPTLPGAGPPAQDKVSEKVSLGSQVDLQRKKRRAPAPPTPQPPTPQPPTPQPLTPPSPLVPPRTQDKEENRKSATGVGRQVPQKPPRGSARGPPQLVLPPPPPYPPPDTDMVEPFGFPGESAGSEASDLRPTLSLPLGPSSSCGTDRVPPVLSEAEETVSVSSCFASEDTAEDSGVVSSPSDIISLDSQHDSLKSKDKWATDQEDGSDQDLAGTPEPGPHKSPTWERNSSGNWHPRPEVTITSSGEEDLFLTGQFQKTLELDEELEELEEISEASSSLPTGSVNGVSPPYVPEATVPEFDEDTIPVTFIGEVFDDPVDSGVFSNRNNNAGSFDLGGTVCLEAPPPPRQGEHSQQQGRKAEGPSSPAPPHDIGKESKPAPSNPSEAVNLTKMEPKVTAAFPMHSPDAEQSSEGPGSALGGKTQASKRASAQPVRDREGEDKSCGSAPPSWYQRGQNPGGSYGLRYGLTTYKIVPPKSEMRCYDRGVSLSTGAIKIDELGNLVSPYVNGGRTTALSPSALDSETQPIGKVKEFWRSNSLEKHSGQPTEGSAKRTPTAPTPAKPQPQESRLPGPKVTSPPQQSAHGEEGRHPEEGGSRPPVQAPGHGKVPAANATEVPFLKPQRRTSSQYVASAIAKKMGPQKAPTDMVRKHGHAKEIWEGRAPELDGPPPARRDGTAPRPYPDTHSPTESEASAVGALPRAQDSSPPGKLCTPDCPAGVHRGPHVPPVRNHVSVTQSWSLRGKLSTRNPGTSSASAPKYTLDGPEPPPPRPGDDQTLGRTLVNGSRWVPIHAEPPCSPRGSGTNNHAQQEPPEHEEKPSLLCTDVPETDGTLPSSIFGPKKKFRPVVQRPAPKDTSLHSALMEAIHSAGGKDRLRKIAEHTSEGGPRKPCSTETTGERSALLAAIRGHRGVCSLRQVSSFASEELRSVRDAEPSSEPPGRCDLGLQPPPSLPPPPPSATQVPSASRTAARSSSGHPAEARQALMDAIRSGMGAARLRKVPLLV